MHTMKLVALREMALRDAPMPSVTNANDVLVRMACVGVCGSDVHYYADGGIGSQRVQYPWTVGHEGAGIVAEVGAKVTHVKANDRVAFDPAQPCGVCDQCLSGRSHTCRSLLFLGCPGQTEGCLNEYIVMPASSVYALPDTLTMEQGALVEPLSVALHAVHLANLKPGANVAILGAGPIGLSVLLWAKARGAGRIYVTDKIDARLQMATRLGADATVNVSTLDAAAQPSAWDAVFECSGAQAAMDDGVHLLRPGGTLLLVGIPGAQNRVSFDINLLRRKELTIQNVRRQNGCVQPCIDALANGTIDALPMITHRLPFSHAPQGFAMVEHYQDGVVKAMIDLTE